MWENFVCVVIFDTCDLVYNWSISLLSTIVLDNLFDYYYWGKGKYKVIIINYCVYSLWSKSWQIAPINIAKHCTYLDIDIDIITDIDSRYRYKYRYWLNNE